MIDQRIFETSQDLILITDRKGTFIRVSPSAMSILGYDPDEMVGRSGAEFLYCEDLDNTRNEMRMSRRAGMTQNFECRYVHKQGRIVTLWWTGVWSASEQQYFFTGRDITDRKETERRLRQSESRFQDIAEVSGDWIWETDCDHRYTLVLGQSTDGLPFSSETLIGRTRWEAAGANPEINELWARHKAHLDSHQPFRHFHYEIRLPSGASMFITASGAQRRVRQSEDRFRSIFSAVSEGIFIASPTAGIFTEVNESGCAMFGYKSDELIGGDMQMISSGVPPYTQRDAMEWHEKAIASGRPQRFEWHCKAKDGRLFWAEVSIRFASISGQDVVLATVRDVTERRTVEAQLRQAQKMEVIGNLTGGMAHDFNNLLGVVVGNLDLARERPGSDEELRELIDEALEAAWRGADLTRRLLAFARRQPLRPSRIDVNELVSDTMRLLRRLLGEDVEMSLNLGAQIWPVMADPAQLEASLVNLATNARDAMPKGGRLIVSTGNGYLDADYAAAHADVTPGEFAMIEVSDTGSGMSADIMRQIFEPFFTTKEVGKGTGLGLSMVFGFMRQSGGHVNVYSEPGVGTTFRLYLPRGAEEASSREVADAVSVARGAGETVLVVEDNPAVRRVVLRQVRELGYLALESDSATGALEVLRREPVSLLFTDIVMPGGLDGGELARLARERWPALKIVLTSGFPQARVDGIGELLDSLPLLSKPYRKEELAAVLHTALDG